MKAILSNDVILKVSISKGTEVGEMPRAADGSKLALDTVRWNGETLVDISASGVSGFYVEHGTFKLHIVPLTNTQYVPMSYRDRKNLMHDISVPSASTIRVKTEYEQDEKERDLYKVLRKGEYPTLSDQLGAIMKYLATKEDLIEELEYYIDEVEKVKVKFPKE